MSASPPRPRVSVVMPVRDAERFVARAVDSILTQTLGDLELIVVDHASSDRTPEILVGHCSGRTPAAGASASTPTWGSPRRPNRACEEARGPLIARMDGDDVAMPGRLERQAAYLADHPSVALVGGAALVIDDAGTGHHTAAALRPATPTSAPILLERNCFIHPTVMAAPWRAVAGGWLSCEVHPRGGLRPLASARGAA